MANWSGTLIRLARLQARLSQRELAELAGTSQPTIAAYERGRKDPTFETLVRIVRATGQDLRIRVVPAENHDEWLRRYEEGLPKPALDRIRQNDREMARAAREAKAL